MDIMSSINEIRAQVKEWKRNGLKVGFVPTMGYLHEGHRSLIERARLENDKVIVSIFVNPTQFGPTEDLEKYPKDMIKDSNICNDAGVDIIFNPTKEEIYFDDFSTLVNMSGLTDELCGKSRPTHFTGVCTVVAKLFNIIPANKAYFGEKDAQQLAIVRKMVRDLNFDIEVIGCGIVREKDGLAKSSRNSYLSEKERKAATILNKSLLLAKDIIERGEKNTNKVIELITENVNKEPLAKIDYIEIVDLVSMKKIKQIDSKALVALAIYIGKTRLIDNFTIEV